MLTIDQFIEDELTEWERLELELLNSGVGGTAVSLPDTWQPRLKSLFPDSLRYELSEPHLELGAWADGITKDATPRPFVAIWPRGRGKSTWAELLAVDLGARKARGYCWYVSETQDQADKHVMTLAGLMESQNVAKYYPGMSRPTKQKTGPQAWRRQLVIADNGFKVEAVGLDKAVRGGKIETERPDLIIFDDVDNKHDTEAAVKKKEGTITTGILPAGAVNVAVLFCQNLIHNGSIAHKLSKLPGETGAADYLTNRIVSGPYPAVEELTYQLIQDGDLFRYEVTAGRSLWNGFDLDICAAEITRDGPNSYELESQHEVDTDSPDALLTTAVLDQTRVSEYPDLVRILIGIDPSGGAGRCGIVAGGKAKVGNDWHGFTIGNRSSREGATSLQWAADALLLYLHVKADALVVERNFGGDMAKNNIKLTKIVKTLNGRVRASEPNDIVFPTEEEAMSYAGDMTAVSLVLDGARVAIIEVTASRGKEVRAEPVATAFQQGRVHHVGRYATLEKQWTQWIPGTKPSPDELDAEVWVMTELGLAGITPSYDTIQGLGSVNDYQSPWE